VALALVRSSAEPLVVLIDAAFLWRRGPPGGVALLGLLAQDPELPRRHVYLLATVLQPDPLHLPAEVAALLAGPVVQKPCDIDDLEEAVAAAAAARVGSSGGPKLG
jgi:hypothetical protein